MGYIKNEVLTEADKLNIIICQMSELQTKELMTSVVDKYAGGHKGRWLWEHLINAECTTNKDAWQWLDEFIGNSATIMFFDLEEENQAFGLSCGGDIVSLIRATFGFEFYLTNSELEFLLCLNHHDVLTACGTAKDWLMMKMRQGVT